MRLSAARASAEIDHGDLIAAANELASAEAGQPTASLLAATLLTRQSGAEAVLILTRLAAVDAVTARGVALRRLFEINPRHVYGLATAAIQSTDVNIRRVGSAALAHRADAESIVQLASLLNDTNPGLRRDVSDSLLRLAEQASLRDVVIQEATDVLSRDAWRGLEHAIIVLATLDHEPVAPRLVELLTHARPEVLVTAAWGLRKLAVAETLPAMFAQAEQQVKLVVDETYELRYLPSIDLQLSQLFQTFGSLGYGEAEPLMRKFIPKTYFYSGATRPAAVWAIGKLNEGMLDEELAKLLDARLSDIASMLPEVEPVRRMSAIGLGRMKAESHLDTLRKFAIGGQGIPGQACAWSIEVMTGEVIRFSLDGVSSTADWFLVPKYANRPTEKD
jgi:HEAT repeat protein